MENGGGKMEEVRTVRSIARHVYRYPPSSIFRPHLPPPNSLTGYNVQILCPLTPPFRPPFPFFHSTPSGSTYWSLRGAGQNSGRSNCATGFTANPSPTPTG